MPSTASSNKKANAGPGYYDLIKEAVIALKDRQGSSRFAIDKYVAAKKGESYQKARLNMALKKGVETGKLVAVKGSFKLAADEKKAAKKAAAPSAAVAAKTKPAAKPKAASTATKKAKGAPIKIAKPAKKVAAKPSKKVTSKKPSTTKKKVVKKSAVKKSTKPAKKA